MTEWVLAVERAYVASATGGTSPAFVASEPAAIAAKILPGRAHGAIGAVASHYLAVGTPRSFGLVVEGSITDAVQSLVAHRTWFAPRDIRCAGAKADELVRELASLGVTLEARATTLAEALACDIVCIHAPLLIEPGAIRRGTHINVLAPAVVILDDLASVAVISHETPGLGQLAAGFVDGRQLDEITIFVLGDAAIARAALGG